jgi:cytochrome c556
MTRSLLTLLLLFVTAGAAFAQETQPDKVGVFMKAKLDHMKRIVEGLALEDFGIIAKHAQELSLISQATNWEVLQTPEYKEHSVDFRKSADQLRNAAMKKNLDGATLAFVQMTMKCVQCHKYVRDTKPIDFNLPPVDRQAALPWMR